MGRLRPDRASDRTSSCRRCQRPAPHLDAPPALYGELITEDGEVVGVICPDCLTVCEQRAIRAEKARVIRRLKRGLPEPSQRSLLELRRVLSQQGGDRERI